MRPFALAPVVLGSLVLAVACGGDETTCEGAGCAPQGAEGTDGGGGTSTDPTRPAGPTDPGAAPAPSGEPGTRASACRGTPATCFCNTAFGGPEIASCGLATGATHCCRAGGDPASASCTCTDQRPNCHRHAGGDICSCSLAQPGQGQTEVGSCTAKPGGVCCVEGSALAPTCACWDKLTTCPTGRPVTSCSVADLACADGATRVDACGG